MPTIKYKMGREKGGGGEKAVVHRAHRNRFPSYLVFKGS